MKRIKISEMQQQYAIAKEIKVGGRFKCPACSSLLTKKSYQHTFCGPKCKDLYWNNVDPRKKNNRTRISPASSRWMLIQGAKRDSRAMQHGYPDHKSMVESQMMDDPSWDAGGGIYLEPCEICGMVGEFCQCVEVTI